ncbi:MAG: DEAD/DEAH box helicase, partial [Victivallaceae bacterium]|nr:DEAD/DEAH box helicase [Victivallaceae bacterium]
MNPVETIGKIEKNLQAYIRRTFPVERSMPEFTEPLNNLFAEYPLAQSPYLEIRPGYASGTSLQELVDQSIIHQETADIFAKAFKHKHASEVHLYQHQTKAIREVCRNGKNLIVCSGTGSGKTECFLIPLVDYIVGQWIDAGKPIPWNDAGVRAMILYPMNALVNDQIRRLRSILRHAPFITFGKYTGEVKLISDEDILPDELVQNSDHYESQFIKATNNIPYSGAGFDDESALPNEVTKRSIWNRTPAHILVTNYSMLERLLLQPETSALFSSTWKFIILDEAHCYNGALGTEIAWLIRRVTKRVGNLEQLRFLATSATLIDDPSLSEDEKEQRIRNEFATKIFPAKSDSFSIQFGQSLEYSPLDTAYSAPERVSGATYCKIFDTVCTDNQQQKLWNLLGGFTTILQEGERKLFSLTQCVMGAKDWMHKLKNAVDLSTNIENVIAIGDAWYIVDAFCNAVEAGLLPLENHTQLQTDIFANESLVNIQMLIRFVIDGKGPLNNNDSWRNILHDYADPKPSQIHGDYYEKKGRRYQKPWGNRLEILEQWQKVLNGNLAVLNGEGTRYLLETATDISNDAELAETQIELMRVGVKLSSSVITAIQQLCKQYQQLDKNLNAATNLLAEYWKNILQQITRTSPQGDNVETLLTWFLGRDGNLVQLSNTLRQVMENAINDGENAKFNVVANQLFGEAGNSLSALNALISLGNMTLDPRFGRPLIDIRYHQLIRGMPELGISFTDAEHFQLYASDALTIPESNSNSGTKAVFTLGACRKCGQPFVLGYADNSILDNGAGPVLLSRIRTEECKYIHAVAWKPGNPYEDEVQKRRTPDLWLNIKTGQAMIGHPHENDNDWISGYWYVGTANSTREEHPEFIGNCPCCHDSQPSQHNTRYGIITPFVAGGEQFKLTLLDELFHQTESSIDPAARRHPGAGRKLLAFSDSRRGAASLAYRYQELFTDVTGGQLLGKYHNLNNAAIHKEIKQSPEFTQQVGPLILNDLEYAEIVAKKLEKYISQNSLAVKSIVFSYVLKGNNCTRLLEISDDTGLDMTETNAAKTLILKLLRKRGRFSLFRRGILRLESKAINYFLTNDGTRNVLLKQLNNRLNAEQLKNLCEQILLSLFERVKLNLSDNFPVSELNSQFIHKAVIRQNSGPNPDLMPFVSKKNLGNRIVREMLPQLNLTPNEAQGVLAQLWPVFTQEQNGSRVLTDIGNAQYCYNCDDIVITKGEQRNQEEVDHSEDYECYITEREIVPTRIEEHTAQVTNKRGAAYQRAFADGRINILSCSTTF